MITDFNRYEDVIHLKKLSFNASSSSQAWSYRLVNVGSNTIVGKFRLLAMKSQ
ncbi:hypothetical protein RI030_11770 [Aphanizomenon flos-aquae NRERC-008]|uniref:Uncharacterized protein n=1 Tax=Aphanizomenon flos-aquae FACHB-1249 TaxID=2692889 RepID=A0ABR8ITQ3_APHFL|nr:MULTISPECIES: hypothetical protein [Aphanizomenon]MCE2906828.1 hypothetical protein [Anabaena sp. CoA2_C59]MDJ0507461.1 hypothetical protein [Nostocales cyanobacterium LE14-WE12]MBD2391389.1 hypothetical protein [Aphanizomenon flos-aquae FACHB-1171]MBD2558420.1 hypothetical protein [Aphanizomenon flos-aquae FACHB-1290]MBD2632377.1 hypothetical protein [Aphanizomenon sp. FACHB-1399]